MVRNIDSSYILYGIGALLGIAAILYFGQEVLLSLSPTVKSALLVLAFGFFLVSGLHTTRGSFSTVLIILAAGAYIIFLGYTIIRFTLTTNQIFLSLAASSALFIGVAYTVGERDIALTRDQAKYLLGGCVLLAALLITGDVLGPQATVSTTIVDSIDRTAAEQGETVVGTIQAANPFILSRMKDLPGYSACLVTANASARHPVMLEDGDGGRTVLLRAGATRVENITVRFPALTADDVPQDLQFPNDVDTIPVEQARRCPDTREESTLVIAERRRPD